MVSRSMWFSLESCVIHTGLSLNPEGGSASCFRVRHQVDGVWSTRKIVPTVVPGCPCHFGSGDHRAYAVDFQMNKMHDELSVSSCVLNKRRLTFSFPMIVQRFLELVESQLQLHDVPFKIQ